ncbi:urease accessory protein UreD [Gymnodinialimonas ceratoperidinii]|uniref:urease accessory protein UreD n=1 Tax=Gymnodinialimonas ceratoperidinii TaxID=2856823 RepID=UPI001FFD211C|nr:urease accessory protein UreD [Gymnodinialimonas ceratoperidinii]
MQPRAIGSAALSVRAGITGRTQIANLRQAGATKLVFPRSYGRGTEAVMVNTAGGVTGGDRFDLDVCVEEDAALTLTTQAAERAYQAQPGEVGHISTRLTVRNGACLNWLPQELILFDRCNLRRRLEISLDTEARLLMVEPFAFGRTAMGESLREVAFQDRIRILRAGRPLYLDGMDLHGDVAAHLQKAATANGATAMASVVMVAPDVSRHVPDLRAMLPETAGVSPLTEDVLVLRLLAPDSLGLRRVLIPVLERLSGNNLPMSWRL